MTSVSIPKVRLDQALPRLIAQGVSADERPKSLDEHLARHRTLREQMGESAQVTRPYVGYIDLIFVAPFIEGSYRWLNYDDLAREGVSESELEKLALRNLNEAVLPAADVKWVKTETAACFHNFASSLLLSEAFWAQVTAEKKNIIAIAPQRDSLIFCVSANTEELAYLDAVRDKFWEDPEVPESAKLCEHFIKPDLSAKSGWRLSAAPSALH
jgi:hypothetical protein